MKLYKTTPLILITKNNGATKFFLFGIPIFEITKFNI